MALVRIVAVSAHPAPSPGTWASIESNCLARKVREDDL